MTFLRSLPLFLPLVNGLLFHHELRGESMKVDWLFKNVTVIDGSGGPQYRADVAVTGDRIVDIAPGLDVEAHQVIEGTGRVLSPGFIDVHTHDDTNVIRIPEYLPKISQGVTTVIVGNCGISAATASIKNEVPDPMNLLGEREHFIYPTVSDYAHAVEAARPALNVGTLIGHTTLRNNHMDSLFREATAQEIAAMRAQLREGLEQGALGLSTGLAYASAFQSSTEEVMSLAEELAAQKGVYTTHLRSEFEPILEALDEAFRIGRHAKVPVVVSHHKCAGAKNWGRTRETLAFFDKMRQRQDIGCDCYPYSASSSTLDLKQVTDEFDITITWSEPHPEQAGKSLQQIANDWQMSMHDAAQQLMPAGAIYYNMDEQDVRRVMRYPVTMIGSDGLPNDPMPHPRLWGAFPRVLGHYCRDEQLFPLTTAVHKMTGLSAARFQLPQRGLVKTGYYADLVLFDPQTIRDVASFDDPRRPAEGIEAVMVNGVMSYGKDQSISGRAGRFLRRHSVE
jgi:N-acyl-D-amino-acid deacylase